MSESRKEWPKKKRFYIPIILCKKHRIYVSLITAALLPIQKKNKKESYNEYIIERLILAILLTSLKWAYTHVLYMSFIQINKVQGWLGNVQSSK